MLRLGNVLIIFTAIVSISCMNFSQNDLKSLINHIPSVPKSSSLKTKKIFNQGNSLLLEQFLSTQNNPLYQDALKILNDATLRSEYGNIMVSIQLFFLNYLTDTLSAPKSNKAVPKQQDNTLDLLQNISDEDNALKLTQSVSSNLLPRTSGLSTLLDQVIQPTEKKILPKKNQSMNTGKTI